MEGPVARVSPVNVPQQRELTVPRKGKSARWNDLVGGLQEMIRLMLPGPRCGVTVVLIGLRETRSKASVRFACMVYTPS